MPLNTDRPGNALPGNMVSLILKLIILTSIVVAVGIAMIMNHRDSVNNALDTGNCLVEEGMHDFFGSLRLFLHQAYRWIFKTCG